MMRLPFKYNQAHLVVLLVTLLIHGCSGDLKYAEQAAVQAEIFPDYYGLTLPPNIAPLNFVIREEGSKFRVKICAGDSESIVLRQRSPSIKIPIKKWHRLLSENKGDSLQVDIWSRLNGEWHKFRSIRHFIAREDIDPWLAYRLVHAVYLKWHDMGIYQRKLENFEELSIIENSSTDFGCMNCHSFANNDPSKMMIHFRILHSGTLLWNNQKLSKVDTRIPSMLSAGIYPSWHPDGTHIAFSTGKISPHVTTRLNKTVDVADRKSDIMVYDVENNRMNSSPVVSTQRRENMPVWSADGRSLYYLSAPEARVGDDESLLHAAYSLMRVPYSTELNHWGEPEVVLDADSIGKSISMPAISPDGRFLICSMSDYGYFTIFHRESDLYCIDLGTGEYWKLGLNSEYADSFSSWSSNGRWLVFSSKRLDEVFSRPYIAYMDENGQSHQAFVLPQKNPEDYFSLLASYNLPKMITGKVELSPSEIKPLVFEEALPVKPGN